MTDEKYYDVKIFFTSGEVFEDVWNESYCKDTQDILMRKSGLWNFTSGPINGIVGNYFNYNNVCRVEIQERKEGWFK